MLCPPSMQSCEYLLIFVKKNRMGIQNQLTFLTEVE